MRAGIDPERASPPTDGEITPVAVARDDDSTPSVPPETEVAEPEARAPVRSLDDYILLEKGDDLPRRLLRTLDGEDRTTFREEEKERALAALPRGDPDLRRVRALVRTARERYDGRFEQAAVDFARQTLGPIVGEDLNDLGRPAAARFESIVVSQFAREPNKQEARRALNVTLLALEVLSTAGLSTEDAMPVLQGALLTGRSKGATSNPRRAQLTQLAEVQMTVDKMRRLLGLIEPWSRMAADALAERDAAVQAKAAAITARDQTLEHVAERERQIGELHGELARSRQEIAERGDRVRDAASIGRRDVEAVRSRALSFLRRSVRPILEMGREAGEVDPPNPRVMHRTIVDSLRQVDKEIEWLNSSD